MEHTKLLLLSVASSKCIPVLLHFLHNNILQEPAEIEVYWTVASRTRVFYIEGFNADSLTKFCAASASPSQFLIAIFYSEAITFEFYLFLPLLPRSCYVLAKQHV